MTALTGHDLAAAIAGALDVEVTKGGVRAWRLPAHARRYAPPALALMAEFSAGVHLRLLTAAPSVELDVTVTRLVQRGDHGAPAPAPFIAVVAGVQTDRVDVLEGPLVTEREDRTLHRQAGGARSTVVLRLSQSRGGDAVAGVADTLASGVRLVEVWLPADAGVVLHRVETATPLAAAPSDDRPRWLHYGSSISHGGNAGSPLGTWPRIAAAELGLEGINLGFGGNAMLDPCAARAIASTTADEITLKVGINIVGADSMRQRTFVPALHGFLDIIREAHPTTPIGLITAIGCPAVETTPGPIRAGADGRATGTPRETRAGDGTLTLSRSRELIEEVAAQRRPDDTALHIIDGLALLAVEEHGYLPDGLHPDPRGYELIAHRFAAMARDEATTAGRVFHNALPGASARPGPGLDSPPASIHPITPPEKS